MIMPPPLRSGAKPKQHRLVTKKMRDQFMLADCGYVVVVDDDPSLRQMVIKYLEDNNVPRNLRQTGQSSIAILRGRLLA
jgi:hypothetical protein